MGRYYTGALTTRECLRLELKYLKKKGLIQRNRKIRTDLEWTTGASVSFRSVFTDEEKYIELRYKIGQEKEEMHYKIQLEELPSNIGKGALLYMVCPVSGLYSRKLYLAYDSPIFKNIKAYRNRIYYPSQVASKTNRYNTKYWELEERLRELKSRRNQKCYKGIETARAAYLRKQYDKLEVLEVKRWEELSAKLQGVVLGYGLF